MTKHIVFIQVQGKPGIVEGEVAETASLGDLHDAFARAGIKIEPDMFVFLEEGDEPLKGERHKQLGGLKKGCRLHVSHCARIKTTVHFLDKTIDAVFPPGAKVRTVKAWAVKEFLLDSTDAAEHVLRICNSTKEPPTDTPLNELVDGRVCSVCFDLVPQKRVEG